MASSPGKPPITNVARAPQVGIIGPFPPPYGGISVSIERFSRLLTSADVDFLIYDEAGNGSPLTMTYGVKGLRRLVALLFWRGPNLLLHYHSPDWRMRCIVSFWGMILRRKTVISIHGQSFDISMRSNFVQRALIRFCLRHTSAVIACNLEIYESVVREIGDSSRVRNIPAFIPPPRENCQGPLEPAIEEFLSAHAPNCLWIGWRENWEGGDLYGIDLVTELLARLRVAMPSVGCIMVFSRLSNLEHIRELQDGIRDLGIQENVLVIPNGYPGAHRLFPRVDLYVRPTRTDGDSVAIREALSVGTPVVASDASPRPRGCDLFRSGDAADFTRVVEEVLRDLPVARRRALSEPPQGGGGDMLEVYRELGVKIATDATLAAGKS